MLKILAYHNALAVHRPKAIHDRACATVFAVDALLGVQHHNLTQRIEGSADFHAQVPFLVLDNSILQQKTLIAIISSDDHLENIKKN